MPRCRVCGREAWVKIPWGNTWFCKEHFIEYFERKVWRTFTKYVPRSHKRILLAVSGGKDSIALLHRLAPRLVKEGYSVTALFIDLGIKGYSDYAQRIVEENVEEIGVDYIVYDLGEEQGFTIDDVASAIRAGILKKPVCSICGLVKRYLYNYIAYKKKYDLVLTGHTLDDMYSFIQADLARGDLADLVKLRPYLEGMEGFIAKARPLFFNYEKENQLYIIARGIKVLDRKCPYTPQKHQPLIDSYKRQLYVLEEKHPGIGLMFVKNFVENIIPALLKTTTSTRKLVRCSICGMPSSTDPCSFCRVKMKLLNFLNKKTD
jgi:uncharacterized protein (TIGR00269 family)